MTCGTGTSIATAQVLPLGLNELPTGCFENMNQLIDQRSSKSVSVLMVLQVPFIKGEAHDKRRFSFEHFYQNLHQILCCQFSFPAFTNIPDVHFFHQMPLNRGVFLGAEGLHEIS